MANPILNNDPLLTVKQVAEYTEMSVSFWEKSRSDGFGPQWIRIGRCARMRKSDLDAWLNTQKDVK